MLRPVLCSFEATVFAQFWVFTLTALKQYKLLETFVPKAPKVLQIRPCISKSVVRGTTLPGK